jgi:peptidyl-prolyl cis-trans isomerase D
MSAELQIQDDAIEAYYQENQGQFQTEESVSLFYLELSFEQIAKGIAISADEARQYFDANPDEFVEPDARNARHILVAFGEDESAAAKLAGELRQRLLAGESFDALAAEYSADTGSATAGGALGWLGPGDSPASEFEDALFALQVDEVSEPVRTEFGYHLIRLDGVRTGKKRSFDEVQDEILQRLRDAEATKIYGDLLDELDERALESMDGLESVAVALDLRLQRVELFTRNGGGPLGNSPELVDAVFSLEVLEDGENTPIIEVGEGRAVVAHVDKYSPAAARPLTEVRETIAEQLRKNEAITLAADVGNQLIAALNSGTDANSLAADKGFEWKQLKDFRRGDTTVAADMAGAVFQAPKPGAGAPAPYRGLMLASGDFAVYRIGSVKPGNPEAYSAEDREMRQRQLSGRLGGAQATAVVEALVDAATISIEPDLLGTEGLE